MRCFGRTRDGLRCRNATGFLVCEKHMGQAMLVGAVLASTTAGAAHVWKEAGLTQRLADVLRNDEWFEGRWEVDVQRTLAEMPSKLLDTPARAEIESAVRNLRVEITSDGGTIAATRRVDTQASTNPYGGVDRHRLAVGGTIRFSLQTASGNVATGIVTEMPSQDNQCSTPVDRTFKIERQGGVVFVHAPWSMCSSTWGTSSSKSSEEAGHLRIFLRRPR
jgi:hypothetical protein